MEEPTNTTQPDAAVATPPPETPVPPADVVIGIRLENNGLNIDVTPNVPTMNEAVHFANWIGQNLDALVLLARQDWHLRVEMELLLHKQKLQDQAVGDEKQQQIVSGAPRLVSASGGPLQ